MEKCLHAYDIVDLKSREYQRTHTKPRHLGDVDGRYRYRSRSCTPTLVGSLVNLELPESRANHPTYTANTIITNQTKQIQTTYEKTNRAATLDAWSYPPLGAETIEVSPPRPHTAGGVHEFNREPGRTTKLQLRPFSTGSPGQRVHPNTPPQLHSYMVAKIKRKRTNSGKSIGGSNSKNVALKTVTTALQQQWEEEDRKDQQTQSPRRVKSQNAKRYDSFAGQWLSFAGGGGMEDGRDGGVLEAFTGEAADEYYNVDARCGVNIANQLIKGNRIQVGKNGILQSNSLKVNQWKNEHPYDRTVSSAYTSTDSMGRKKKPPVQIVPLSWEDQLSKPDVKVLGMKEKDAPPPKSDLCDRRPVVYEKLVKSDNLPQNRVPVRRQQSSDNYKIKLRTKNKRNIDGTKSLNNRITMISVDQVRDDRDSMCSEDYEELLHRSLQTADIKDELDKEETDGSEDGVLENRGEDSDQFASSMSSGRLAMSPEEELMPSIIGHQRSNRYQDDGFRSSSQGRGSPLRQMSVVSEVDFNANSELPIRLVSMVNQEESETPDNWRNQQLSPTSSPRQRSGGFPPRQLSARPAPSASSTVTSARTRSQQQVRSAPPKRAQSSPARRTSKPHYQFDEAPTPRNLHSPRPNLVKAGQLQRSGVASISSNQDVGGDHEYIKISHQLRPGSHLRNRSHSTLPGPPGGGSDLSTSSHAGDHDRSDTVSIDSMDVNKGDHDHRTMDHDREECTCSPDVKRALSAALSHQSSHPTDPSGPVFYIPTADSAESDIFSGRAGGGGRGGGSVMSFYSDKSDPLDGYESELDSGRESPLLDPNPNEQKQMDPAHLPAPNQGDDDQSGNTRELPDSSSPPLPGAASSDARDQQEVEFFINQIDGLSFNHADIEEINQDMSASRLNSAAGDRKKRTVKFADEQGSMSTSVPQCTPMSTPREHPSDSEMPS